MVEPWAVSALTAWLRAMSPKVDSMGPYELLEISPTDDLEKIRAAYHAIAATRHPDRFRGKLGEAESETLMRVFGRVSNAYATLRDPDERKKFGGKRVAAERAAAKPPDAPILATAVPSATPTPTTLRKIATRALSHVRRAEACAASGDLASAVLHLKMAVAADPQATELRALLAETQAKLKR